MIRIVSRNEHAFFGNPSALTDASAHLCRLFPSLDRPESCGSSRIDIARELDSHQREP